MSQRLKLLYPATLRRDVKALLAQRRHVAAIQFREVVAQLREESSRRHCSCCCDRCRAARPETS